MIATAQINDHTGHPSHDSVDTRLVAPLSSRSRVFGITKNATHTKAVVSPTENGFAALALGVVQPTPLRRHRNCSSSGFVC